MPTGANVWTQFRRLLPSQALLSGQVTAHNSDGTSLVALPDGAVIKAYGTQVDIGSRALVRAGEIIGEAPNLPTYDAEV